MTVLHLGEKTWGIYPGREDAFNAVKYFKTWRETYLPPLPNYRIFTWGKHLLLKATYLEPEFYTAQMRWRSTIEIADVQDMTKFETFRGWIWRYLPWSDEWILLVDSVQQGEQAFWIIHDLIKH